MPLPTSSDAANPHIELSSWHMVVESMRGGIYDYTTIPLNRAVLLLGVPMVVQMLIESLFAVTNIFWAGRLGRAEVAIVGLTEAVMFLIAAAAVGLGAAAVAIVSRRIGKNDARRAAQAAGQIVVLGVGVSAALGLILGCFSKEALGLVGADESTAILGRDFARIMFGCNATLVLMYLLNAIFRGAGDVVLAMRTLWLAIALNIVLGPCLIFGWGPFPELGVTGAAVATNIGRGVGVLYQFWLLLGRHSRIHMQLRDLKMNVDDLKRIMTTAFNAIVQALITAASWIALVKIVALYGNAALAGYTLAMRVVMFALMPALGLASAGAALVGQNLGAGQPARAEEVIRVAVRFNAIFLGIAGALFVSLAGPIVSMFTSDAEVLSYGIHALWAFGLASPIQAAGLCFAAAFNGAGDTRTPTQVSVTCLFGQVLLAWILAQVFELDVTGVFIAVPVSNLVLTLWIASLFKRGHWKHHEI